MRGFVHRSATHVRAKGGGITARNPHEMLAQIDVYVFDVFISLYRNPGVALWPTFCEPPTIKCRNIKLTDLMNKTLDIHSRFL